MPTARKLIAGLALALTAVSCTDKGPTTPTNTTDQNTPVNAAKPVKQPLNFPASEVLPTSLVDGVTYTLTNIQVTQIARNTDAATSAQFPLLVSGVFTFTGGGVTKTEAFTNKPANLTGSGAPTQPTCQILTLDLGPLHLDLLGLVVDLAPVHLNITAQSGPGNLLGNLLCAVTHLLDQNPLSAALQSLLDQINAIIAAL